LKKLYILDTNVLLNDPNSIYSYGNNTIILPFSVLEEVDKKKNIDGVLGANARQVIRSLDKLRGKKSLSEGVKLGPKLGSLFVCDLSVSKRYANNNDNKIILTAVLIKESNPDKKIIIVSRDINVRVKADSLGLQAEDYQTNKVVDKKENIYSGFSSITVDDQLIDRFYNKESIVLEKENYPRLYQNQFLMLVSSQHQNKTAIARFTNYNTPLRKVSDFKQGIFGLKPKNKEQQFALDLLMDPKIPVVSLAGIAGGGKSLISCAAGLEQTYGKGKQYKRLIIIRPIVPLDRGIGYLPGGLEEKMEPWMAPIIDQLRYLFGNDKMMLEECIKNGIIELEAMTYIRGRNISDAFIIFDEAQNCNNHEIKTVLTRVGDNTKIVITGDLGQIDNFYINETTSGLTNIIEKLKNEEIAGHITFQKGERSIVATICSKLL
jgi:PhoH-like ATPase